MDGFVRFTCDDEILRIGRGLKDRTLPKAEWTHAAHFAAAMWLIVCCREVDAKDAMPGMIRAYNEATGVANTDTSGYHETITQASLRAAGWFFETHSGCTLFEVCNGLMKSRLGRSDWLLDYWTRPVLFSVEARRRWVAPDIEALPF
jgi:hypothetical protein